MKPYMAKVYPGGRMTVPATIRDAHDLRPGDVVIWFEQDDELCFRKATPDEATPAQEEAGSGKGQGPNMKENVRADVPHSGLLQGSGRDPEASS